MTTKTTILPGVPGHRWKIEGGDASLLDSNGKIVWSGVQHDLNRRSCDADELNDLREVARALARIKVGPRPSDRGKWIDNVLGLAAKAREALG